MAVETLAAALEREHRDVDAGIEVFTAGHVAGEPDPAPLLQAVSALRRHIYLEEEFLFPPLRDAGLAMPVFVMLKEHGQMWTILDELEAEVARDPRADKVGSLCTALVDGLASHNVKEEAVIYPPADSALSPVAREELGVFIASGRMPQGWVCAQARS